MLVVHVNGTVVVVAVPAVSTGVVGGVVSVTAAVVALTVLLGADLFPGLSTAFTVYAWVVPGARPVSVKLAAVGLLIGVVPPSR